MAPLSAQNIPQALRFKILPIGSSFLDGNPHYPGTSSTDHAFIVTSDLGDGFTIEVDPHGPALTNTTGTAFDFSLDIFVEGISVGNLNLGDLGDLRAGGTRQITVAAAQLPQPFAHGQHIVLSGVYLMPSGFTPLTLRWCFDSAGTSRFEYPSPSPYIDPEPAFYKRFAFNYQPNASPPTLNFNTTGPDYQIDTNADPFPGYTDPIAANYGTDLVFHVSTREVPLADTTSTLYYDQDENGILDGTDAVLDIFSQNMVGAGNVGYPLVDTGQAEEGVYFLRVEARNVFNLSTVAIVPLTSLRALDWPEHITWDLEIHRSGGVCQNNGFTTNPETVSQETVHYAHVPPCNNPGDAHDLIVKLKRYRDAHEEKDYDASAGIGFDVRLLVSKRSGCSPLDRVAKTPGSGGLGVYNFLDVENNGPNAQYVWGMRAASPYPAGDYVELALVEMEDQRSGKKLGVEGLPLSTGASIGGNWPYNRPKHRLRLVGDSSPSAACQTFDFSFYEAGSCATEISELDYVSGQDLAFSLEGSLPGLVAPYGHNFYVIDDDGNTLAHTLNTGIPASPVSGVCYPFQVQMNQAVSEDFTIRFELSNHNGVTIAKEIRVKVAPAPTEPVITNVELDQPPTANDSVALDGSVHFNFEVDYVWTEQPDSVFWRWQGSNGQGPWQEAGLWASPAGPLAEILPGGGGFSGNWEIDPLSPLGKAIIKWRPSQSFVNYISTFFGSVNLQSVEVEVELRFPGNHDASFTSASFDLTLEPLPSSLGSVRAGYSTVPGDYETVTYNAGQEAQLFFVLEPQPNQILDMNQVRVSLGGSATRLPLTGNFVGIDPVQFIVTGPIGGLASLANAGKHDLIFYPNETDPGILISVQAIEPKPVLVRYHLRDHLGSSAITQTFRSFPVHVQNVGDFTLASIPFYDHGYSETRYEPFGERLNNNVADELKARYTDHEFDGTTGFNYMKGRFQLANYAKFNRPDPMRDWDWLQPHTINLYEHVGNDPINSLDPDGYGRRWYNFWHGTNLSDEEYTDLKNAQNQPEYEGQIDDQIYFDNYSNQQSEGSFVTIDYITSAIQRRSGHAPLFGPDHVVTKVVYTYEQTTARWDAERYQRWIDNGEDPDQMEMIWNLVLSSKGRTGKLKGGFRGPAAQKFNWTHIFNNHAPWGRVALQRTRMSRNSIFQGLNESQIMARVKGAWKDRELVGSQTDPYGVLKAKYRGVDPGSGSTLEFWFDVASKTVDTAYPIKP